MELEKAFRILRDMREAVSPKGELFDIVDETLAACRGEELDADELELVAAARGEIPGGTQTEPAGDWTKRN